MHECNQAISGWKEYHMSENTISLYVYKGGQGEITEKKSRFIATVRPVESEDEAVSFINETKKKYWDARHNCSAFVIGKRQELTRCSDDGEPAGTAGRPMLDVLLKENIHNAAVVVTRYFGGVLLGTGGLVRAYQQATKAGLLASEIIEKKDGAVLFIKTVSLLNNGIIITFPVTAYSKTLPPNTVFYLYPQAPLSHYLMCTSHMI